MTKNRRFTINGKTRILAEWARISGIYATTLEYRLRIGWNPVDAITVPVGYGSAAGRRSRWRVRGNLLDGKLR